MSRLFLFLLFVSSSFSLFAFSKYEFVEFTDSLICKENKLPPTDSILNIVYLNLYSPEILSLPEDIHRLKHLKKITLATNYGMSQIPKSIGRLEKLESLYLTKAFNIKTLPDEICDIKSLKMLTVAWGGALKSIPDSIGNLENLYLLDLGRNKLTTLPNSIQNLKNLKILVLWDNPISKVELLRIQKLLPNTKIFFDKPIGY